MRRPVRFMTALGTAAREVRPDVVLEISPHMALTPAARHRLAGQDRPPDCVRTLGRDEDSRLSFHQALAALYRAVSIHGSRVIRPGEAAAGARSVSPGSVTALTNPAKSRCGVNASC